MNECIVNVVVVDVVVVNVVVFDVAVVVFVVDDAVVDFFVVIKIRATFTPQQSGL